MNAEKLLTYIGWLLYDEKRFSVQNALEELDTSLSNLASMPQEPSYQEALVTSLSGLDTKLSELIETYDAIQMRQVIDIGAEPYFTDKLVQGIRKSISENAMTPTVAHAYVSEVVKRRAAYLAQLKSTQQGLKALSITAEDMDEGTAEIGFQLPRALFNNDLDGLVKELRALKRIISAFSEVAVGTSEPIEVRQISTSDPIFYFGLGALTITQIGDAVNWALERWKQIEDIRKVRAETKKLKVFDASEVKDFFDKKIEEQVKAAIEEKTTELVGAADGPSGRRHEQRTDVAWALESILARVERGMTVEIKFIAPKALEEGQEETKEQKANRQTFDKLSEITKDMNFTPVEASPVLALPEVPSTDRSSARTRRPKAST